MNSIFMEMASYIETASGNYTEKYINAFNNYATDVDVEKYLIHVTGWPGTFPHQESGYEDYNTTPVTGIVQAFVDPINIHESARRSTWTSTGSVSYPTVIREGIDFRKFYLSPAVASGWICPHWIPGQDYAALYGKDVVIFYLFDKWFHIQTIIPHFLANQIAYYECLTQQVSDYYWPFENVFDINYTPTFSERAL